MADGPDPNPRPRDVRRFDPFDPVLRTDPYPVYARFRRDAPIHVGVPPLSTLPECHYLFRYRDVDAAARDPRFGRARGLGYEGVGLKDAEPLRRMARRMLLFSDPPDHTRLRGLVARAMAPFLVDGIEERTRIIITGLLDRAESRGSLDLMADYAIPLPVMVIADLMGIPEEDRSRFQELSEMVMAMSDVRRDGRVLRRARKGAVELWEYLEAVVAERRGRPGSDLISRLLAVEHEGERLSDEEVLANCGLLLIAGHETTRNLIGNGTLALLQNRDQLRRLRANPGLLESGIHELLRYDSPIQITFRVAAEDVPLGDTRIRKGQAVALVLGSANRDAETFHDPNRLDLSRDSRRHLAFSAGSHYCLGAPLAVLEARMAIAALLERFEEIRPLMEGEPDWDDHVVFRGLRTLPIRVSGGLAVPSREPRA